MARKRCKVNLHGSPMFKPKGCTTKKGIGVGGTNVMPDGKINKTSAHRELTGLKDSAGYSKGIRNSRRKKK